VRKFPSCECGKLRDFDVSRAATPSIHGSLGYDQRLEISPAKLPTIVSLARLTRYSGVGGNPLWNGHSDSSKSRTARASSPGLSRMTILDEWIRAAELHAGKVFRCVCRAGKCWGDGVTERVVWHVVKSYAAKVGLAGLAPHDLRRSCAKLCHSAGGELEQIQFLLGHVSVQTTERYLGRKQRIRGAVNDSIGIEP
jgi:hypothetical protein